MFALAINYLNGWSMAAADGARKQQAEWPPHPDRVFMALAAAWFETREDSDESRQERAALEWLEALPPPAMAASIATMRSVVTSYVPVNDSGRAKYAKEKSAMTIIEKLKSEGLAYLPEHRVRQPRSFPVAIPHDPVVRLIWREADLGEYQAPLERLAAKTTHVGHSSSFVQMWLEPEPDIDIVVTWEPTDNFAIHRLRVPSAGSLCRLHRPFLSWWDAYRSHETEVERTETELKTMTPPPRKRWLRNFPDAVMLADEQQTKQHSAYPAAKSGNSLAATRLVTELVDSAGLTATASLIEKARTGSPILICAHAYEHDGVNAIPTALAKLLSERLKIGFDPAIIQSNVVSHTGASGYGRLSRQARFEGDIEARSEYVMVDDFVGQGGTLANLRGWVEKHHGRVIGAIVLTGKPYSAKLSPSREQIHELTQKHGKSFEDWWKAEFGHTFDCLTQSEARYLTCSPDVDTIRDRLAQEKREGDSGDSRRDIKEQKRYLRELQSWHPPHPTRPVPGKWQGYAAPRQSSSRQVRPHSHFDPHIIVLGIASGRFSLRGTLKLTAALRGLLMGKCPQPPPEWFSGHQADGKPAKRPHLALMPLPFVGSEHADGRIMGLALILPRELDAREAGDCLERILRDARSPQKHRLFDGDHFECNLALEVRERPPASLQASTWTRPSRAWASVTPIVLDRHFDAADRAYREEQEANNIRNMCQRIDLPQPSEVHVHPVSRIKGVPHARDFPQLVRKRDGGRLRHTHALIVFAEPVEGPVLLGAGRFRGYGACRPIELEQC